MYKPANSVLILFTILIVSCSAPKLSKRYKSSKNRWIADTSVKNYVKVETQAYKTKTVKEETNDNTTPKTFFNFPVDSQKDIIAQLTKRNSNFSISSLLQEVNSKPQPKEAKVKEGITTYSTKYQNNVINKNIVFSVTRVFTSDGEKFKTINNVGDRIQYLDLELEIENSPELKFINWNKFANDYTTVDFGTITSSKSISAEVSVGYEANAGLEVTDGSSSEQNDSNTNTINNTSNNTINTEDGGNTSSNSISDVNTSVLVNTLKNINNAANKLTESTKVLPNAKISGTDKLDESRQFKNEILKLTGTLKTDSFTIKQEGYEGVNLKGNTSINVDIKFDGNYQEPITVVKFDNFYKKNPNGQSPNTFDKLNKHYTNIFIPEIQNEVKASVGYKYLYRSIRKGDQYIPEYKQKVKFLFGEIPNKTITTKEKFVLIKKSDFIPTLYIIKSGTKEVKLENQDLVFESKIDAMNFVSWLNFSNDKNFLNIKLSINDTKDLKVFERAF